MAVLGRVGQPRFHFPHPLPQRRNPLTLARILGFHLGNAFVWLHAPMLYPQRNSA
jgi:hypothetical protein